MKKFLAILLVCVFAFAAVACSEGSEGSDPAFTNSGTTSKSENSSKAEESSKTESSVADDSSGVSDETSEPVVEETDVIQFISWKNPFYDNLQGARDTDATSLELNTVNAELVAGKNGAFNFAYGESVEIGAEYAAFTFKYDHSVWGYVRSEYAAAGESKVVIIPTDGFVAAVAQENNDKIEAINAVDATVTFFPHGFAATSGLNSVIMKAETAPAIDGKVSSEEYGDVMWTIDPESIYFSYAQFEVNNYNATAEIYMTYDADNLYLGIVVDTPDHFCSGNAGDLWKETAVQFNVSSVAPDGEYMFNRWFQDNNSDPVNQEAYNSNRVRQHTVGYDANNNVEVTTNYFVINGIDNKEYKGSREGQITTYEVAIPWADLGANEEPVAVEAGTKIGFGLCINSGDEATAAAGKLQTIAMRDGGSVIGVIDHTKMATITLG